jgi:hypothetical protein
LYVAWIRETPKSTMGREVRGELAVGVETHADNWKIIEKKIPGRPIILRSFIFASSICNLSESLRKMVNCANETFEVTQSTAIIRLKHECLEKRTKTRWERQK